MTSITTPFGRRSFLGGAAAAGAALYVPSAIAQSATPKRGGTLNAAATYNPSSLDPIVSHTQPDRSILQQIHDALFETDPHTLEVKPGLAKSWKWTDPKTLVIDLQEGVTFHDGAAFDAQAAKINLDRARGDKLSNYKNDLAAITDIEVKGTHQIILHLSRASASLPSLLAERGGFMVSPKAIASGKPLDRAPVGSGPFKFVSWQDNDRIVLVKNENYWKKGLPYLDGISIRIMNEVSAELRSVAAGESDVAYGLQVVQKPVADRSKGVHFEIYPSNQVWITYLNFAKAPLDNLKLRQALNYGIDRDSFSQAIAYGLDTPTSSMISDRQWMVDKETFGFYKYDPDKARQLVKDAGYPNGVDVPMVAWSDQAAQQRNEILTEQLSKVGIRLKLTPGSPPETATWFFGPEKKGSGRIAASGGYPDPAQFYSQMFAKGSYFNAGGVEPAGFADLYNATETATDEKSRKAAFGKLQAFAIDQALALPIAFYPSCSARSDKVHGFIVDLTGRADFRETWLG